MRAGAGRSGTLSDITLHGWRPSLYTQAESKAKARMAQAISLFDAHGFRPLILDHYANAVFAKLEGQPSLAATSL